MFYFIFFSLRCWLAGSGPLIENSINFFFFLKPSLRIISYLEGLIHSWDFFASTRNRLWLWNWFLWKTRSRIWYVFMAFSSIQQQFQLVLWLYSQHSMREGITKENAKKCGKNSQLSLPPPTLGQFRNFEILKNADPLHRIETCLKLRKDLVFSAKL